MKLRINSATLTQYMKQLYLLVLFILYFFVSFGQPDPQDNNSVHFILKQAIAHKPGFLLFGRSNASMFVNMAVVETKQQRINWFYLPWPAVRFYHY